MLRLVGARVITAEQARKQHWETVRRVMAQAVSDDGKTAFPIICNGCGEITVVASDVQRYRCKCSPDVERYTAQSRFLDLPIGKSAVTDLIASTGGRAAVVR